MRTVHIYSLVGIQTFIVRFSDKCRNSELVQYSDIYFSTANVRKLNFFRVLFSDLTLLNLGRACMHMVQSVKNPDKNIWFLDNCKKTGIYLGVSEYQTSPVFRHLYKLKKFLTDWRKKGVSRTAYPA